MYDPEKLDPYHGVALHASHLWEIARYLRDNPDACDPDKMVTIAHYLKILDEIRHNLKSVENLMYYSQCTYGEDIED